VIAATNWRVVYWRWSARLSIADLTKDIDGIADLHGDFRHRLSFLDLGDRALELIACTRLHGIRPFCGSCP
jgi:hypothetical protein